MSAPSRESHSELVAIFNVPPFLSDGLKTLPTPALKAGVLLSPLFDWVELVPPPPLPQAARPMAMADIAAIAVLIRILFISRCTLFFGLGWSRGLRDVIDG